MTHDVSATATFTDPATGGTHHHGFEPVVITGDAGAAHTAEHGLDQAAEIADAMISLIRTYGNLKTRLASSVDSEVASLFLLVRLVKDGPKRAKELAEAMCADQSTVSRQVAGLVKSGLIERKADPDDGRASILVPTQLGVDRVHEHFVNRGQAIEPIIGDWPEADREQFLRLLRRYNSSLDLRRDDVLTSMARSHALAHPVSGPQPHHPRSQDHSTTHAARIERSN